MTSKELGSFKKSAALSLGVELELQLLSSRDFGLTRAATDLLDSLDYDGRFGEIKLEITESMILRGLHGDGAGLAADARLHLHVAAAGTDADRAAADHADGRAVAVAAVGQRDRAAGAQVDAAATAGGQVGQGRVGERAARAVGGDALHGDRSRWRPARCRWEPRCSRPRR